MTPRAGQFSTRNDVKRMSSSCRHARLLLALLARIRPQRWMRLPDVELPWRLISQLFAATRVFHTYLAYRGERAAMAQKETQRLQATLDHLNRTAQLVTGEASLWLERGRQAESYTRRGVS